MIDTSALSAISLLAGALASIWTIRHAFEENAKKLSEHVTTDATFQTIIIDRLARIETKLGMMMEQHENEP